MLMLRRRKLLIYENGGIADDRFITQPDSIEQDFKTKDIPTKFSKTWNRLKTDQFYLTGRYNLGYRKEPVEGGEKGEFVPVASLILTSRYREQYRRFLSYDTAYVDQEKQIQAIDTVYRNRFLLRCGRRQYPLILPLRIRWLCPCAKGSGIG